MRNTLRADSLVEHADSSRVRFSRDMKHHSAELPAVAPPLA